MQKTALKHIFVIGLPQEENKKLIYNLINELKNGREGKKKFYYPRPPAGTEAVFYCLPEQETGKEWGMGRIRMVAESEFLSAVTNCPPEESLMVSGDACCLELAENYGMAALAYIGNGAGLQEEQPVADMYAEGFEEIGWYFLTHVYERHHGLPWTILETERCVLREFSLERLPELFALYEEKEMTAYIEPLYPYEKEKEYQKAYIEHMYGFYGFGMWIVCDKRTDTLIGRAGLEYREESGGMLELGYAIGVPYQRQGYGQEACQAILSYAKEELGEKKVCCMIRRENKKSLCLAEKLGFSPAEECFLDGKQMIKYEKELEACEK